MKNYILSFFSTITFITGCFSQPAENKNFLSFSLGGALPIGNFASTNPYNSSSGYSIAGENAAFSFEHKLNKTFGLTAILQGTRNGINTKAINEQYKRTLFYDGSMFSDWDIKKSAFYTESFLVGGTGSFAIGSGNKLLLSTRAAIGIVRASSARLDATGFTDSSAIFIKQNNASGYGLGLLAGAGLGYRLTKKIQILVGADYFVTNKIEMKNITTSYIIAKNFIIPGIYTPSNASSVSYESITRNQHQPFSAVNLHAGISLAL